MYINKSNFYYILLLTCCFIIVVFAPMLLPARFYYDSKTILTNPYNLKGLKGSYEFSIWFYKFSGLSKLPYFLIGIIQFSISSYLIYKIIPPKNYHKITLKLFLIWCLYIVLAIFMATPTKEFITFVYFSLIVLILIKNKSTKINFVKICLMVLFYSYFFRDYFILVLFTSFALFFLMKIKISNRNVLFLIYGLLIVIGISVFYGFVKGKYISEITREPLNSRRTTDNNSAIQSPVKTDTWYGESIGILNGFISVNYPVNAFARLSPPILFFATFQLLLMFYLIKKLEVFVISDTNNLHIWFFYFCFSYFFVQALFEPDLGSSIRHKIGVFPLLYYMFNYEYFKKTRREYI